MAPAANLESAEEFAGVEMVSPHACKAPQQGNEEGQLRPESRQLPKISLWWTGRKDLVVAGCMVLLFLLHPALTTYALELFACRRFKLPGEAISASDKAFLVRDPSIQCYDGWHWVWMWFAGIPMLLVYSAGIPLLGLFLLRRNNHKLDDYRVEAKYAFLYKDYKPGYYYWEAVIYARKLAVMTISIFWIQKPGIQGIIVILVINLAFLAHAYSLPFQDRLVNLLEFLSLSVSLFTFIVGQLTLVSEEGALVQTMFLGLCAISNCLFLLLCLYLLFFDVVRRLAGHEGRLRNGLENFEPEQLEEFPVRVWQGSDDDDDDDHKEEEEDDAKDKDDANDKEEEEDDAKDEHKDEHKNADDVRRIRMMDDAAE